MRLSRISSRRRCTPRVLGQTNLFLSRASTSLVSRTWRAASQPLLLRKGLLSPLKVDGFLVELDRAGLRSTLDAVRVGVSELEDTRGQSAGF